jgi:hypothetical protein
MHHPSASQASSSLDLASNNANKAIKSSKELIE